MASAGTTRAIPTEQTEIVEFFDKYLGDVQFPDVDRNRLVELAAAVQQRFEEVARFTEQLRSAREALERAQGDLVQATQRGLAYARVYADGDEALSAALAELAPSRAPAESSKPRRRGRGRKKSDTTPESEEKPTLPFAGKDLGKELTEAA